MLGMILRCTLLLVAGSTLLLARRRALLLAMGCALTIALVHTLLLLCSRCASMSSRFGLNLKVRLENNVSLWRRVILAKLIGSGADKG